MKSIITVVLLSLLSSFSSPMLAQAKLNPYPQDKRLVHVAYQEHNVIPLNTQALTTTQITFATDEAVVDVEGGDSASWLVTTHAELPNMVFIKPTVLDSDSNLTIVTTKHSYYFHLHSAKTLYSPNTERIYAITLTYPDDEARKLQENRKNQQAMQQDTLINPGAHPERYHWHYRFSGSAQLTPLHVFDDGTFTYFELAATQAVPAVFAVEDVKGHESVVNVRRVGKYLVVQRTAPQFTLRRGANVTSVFNTTEITRIQHNRRPQ